MIQFVKVIERFVEIPVPSSIIREYASAPYSSDFISEGIMDEDKELLLDQLEAFGGPDWSEGKIILEFIEDENMDPYSSDRKIRVTKLTWDENHRYEIAPRVEQYFLLRADMRIERTN